MPEMLYFNDVKSRLGVSESTLMDMILHRGFPMVRNAEGTFEMTDKDFVNWSNPAPVEKKEPSPKMAKTTKSRK